MKIKIVGVKLVEYSFNGKQGVSQQAYYVPIDVEKKNTEFGVCPDKLKFKDLHGLFGVSNHSDIVGKKYEIFFDQYKNPCYGREIK